jgi:hypothetical protein
VRGLSPGTRAESDLCATTARQCPQHREVACADFFNRDDSAALQMFPNFRRMLTNLFDEQAVWDAVLMEVGERAR